MNNIIVFGGAGYIGSHLVSELLKNYRVFVIDNLITGHYEAIFNKVNSDNIHNLHFFKADLKKDYVVECVYDYLDLYSRSFGGYECAICLAGSSIVSESNLDPISYYDNNLKIIINVLKILNKYDVNKFIFSSTAAVYGDGHVHAIKEYEKLNPINVYGKTKLMSEQIINDYILQNPKTKYLIFRYFNVAGAHNSGFLGELHEPESHLIPKTIVHIMNNINPVIYGNDYNTKDGTCIRDYIHVMDLAYAHLLGLEYLDKEDESRIINLGSGKGYSNKEVVSQILKSLNSKMKINYVEKRIGDPDVLLTLINRAKKYLKWVPKYNLKDIIDSDIKFRKGV